MLIWRLFQSLLLILAPDKKTRFLTLMFCQQLKFAYFYIHFINNEYFHFSASLLEFTRSSSFPQSNLLQYLQFTVVTTKLKRLNFKLSLRDKTRTISASWTKIFCVYNNDICLLNVQSIHGDWTTNLCWRPANKYMTMDCHTHGCRTVRHECVQLEIWVTSCKGDSLERISHSDSLQWKN